MSSKPKPITRDEMIAYTRRAALSVALVPVVLGTVVYLLVTNRLHFDKYQNMKVSDLTPVAARLQYVIRHSTPGIVWLFLSMLYVISKRVGTRAAIPTSGNEHLTESAKMHALNTLEQWVMSFGSQLVLVTYLEPRHVVNVIPVLNILFLAGRVFFWLGYPMNRAFGMSLNFVPLFATLCYISYKYFTLFSH